MKNWFLVTFYPCVRVLPVSLPQSLHPEFYLPFPFSLPFCRLHHFLSEKNRGDRLSFGANPRHRFHILNWYSSSLFNVFDSSLKKSVSPARDPSYYPILSLFDPSSLNIHSLFSSHCPHLINPTLSYYPYQYPYHYFRKLKYYLSRYLLFTLPTLPIITSLSKTHYPLPH